MSFDWRTYNREYQRKVREKKYKQLLISQGKCPIIEILLMSKYHPQDCPCGIRITNGVTLDELTLVTYTEITVFT